MRDFTIKESTGEEIGIVNRGIVEFNLSKVPPQQETTFIFVNRVIKSKDDTVLAGINSIIYSWNCLYVDILWVKEEARGLGYGSALLKEVESIAKEKGCNLVHLDTFDFQAKDFYLKQGYEIFGVLDNCPTDHKRYYMKKNI